MLYLLFSLVAEPDQERVLKEIYRKLHPALYRYALSILGRSSLAEEVVQEAFVRALGQGQTFFSIPCQERLPWMVIIVKHLSFNVLKKEGRSVPLAQTWEPPPVDSLQERSEFRRLVGLIRGMPEQYRRVLELKFVLEWTDKEIARELGLSVSTVSKRISRGRILLQKVLIKEGFRDKT